MTIVMFLDIRSFWAVLYIIAFAEENLAMHLAHDHQSFGCPQSDATWKDEASDKTLNNVCRQMPQSNFDVWVLSDMQRFLAAVLSRIRHSVRDRSLAHLGREMLDAFAMKCRWLYAHIYIAHKV